MVGFVRTKRAVYDRAKVKSHGRDYLVTYRKHDGKTKTDFVRAEDLVSIRRYKS